MIYHQVSSLLPHHLPLPASFLQSFIVVSLVFVSFLFKWCLQYGLSFGCIVCIFCTLLKFTCGVCLSNSLFAFASLASWRISLGNALLGSGLHKILRLDDIYGNSLRFLCSHCLIIDLGLAQGIHANLLEVLVSNLWKSHIDKVLKVSRKSCLSIKLSLRFFPNLPCRPI